MKKLKMSLKKNIMKEKILYFTWSKNYFLKIYPLPILLIAGLLIKGLGAPINGLLPNPQPHPAIKQASQLLGMVETAKKDKAG
ncbi:MAG: hypothetical protein GY797_38880 [Deltaproteobacteria bacterium]|nr:hypothetical protein [Deltaproteobacteria bacterium]